MRIRDNQESFDGGRGLPVEDATWESEQILQCLGVVLLEDKKSQKGRIVMSLSE